MMIDFVEPVGSDGWFMCNSALPTEFPAPPKGAFIPLHCMDNYKWLGSIDARLLAVSPALAVPLPPAFSSGLQETVLSAAAEPPNAR
jgi:hypothetical protein